MSVCPVGHLEALPESGPGARTPAPLRPGGPEVLVGGFAPAALARVGRFGDGLLCAAQPAWAAGLFADLGADEVGGALRWATDPTQLDRLADLTA